MSLKRTIGATLFFVIALLGFALPAQAVVTAFWSAGNTCAGAATGTFQTSGPTIQFSLCTTTTAGDGVCGATIQPLAANAGENNRFNITARTLGAADPDPNTPVIVFPVGITNPNAVTDFGGTVAAALPPPAAANQLLATFTLAPQATATNASYVIGLSAITAVTTSTTDCFLNPVDTIIAPTFTLNLVAGPVAPTITSAATTTFTVGTAGTFTVTATGSPAPTLSVAPAPPAPVTFTPGTGVLAGTPTTAGTFPLTFTAANGTLPNATQAFSLVVNKGNQTITFAPATPQPFSASPFTVTATATSGLPVALASTTPAVCSVAGFVVTFITAGTCTLNATQAGNANWNAATAVPASIVITASAPAAPTIGAATPGNLQATIAFTPPANNGGSPITGYTVTCNPGAITMTGAVSPITVTGLTNLTLYTCFVFATNALGNSANSGNVTVTPTAVPPALVPVPTLSEWAMLMLFGLLLVLGARRIRSIRAAS
jgi:hypothetical protein